MFDRNTTSPAIRSRTARSGALTTAGLVVAALAFFSASPASAEHRHYQRGHYAGCRDHGHYHGHGHHDLGHHHYRHAGWHSGFGFGLFLPHFELRLDHPYRAHRIGRHHHNVWDRKHRDRRQKRSRRHHRS